MLLLPICALFGAPSNRNSFLTPGFRDGPLGDGAVVEGRCQMDAPRERNARRGQSSMNGLRPEFSAVGHRSESIRPARLAFRFAARPLPGDFTVCVIFAQLKRRIDTGGLADLR